MLCCCVQNALDLSVPASDALVENRKTAWVQLAGHAGTWLLTYFLLFVALSFWSALNRPELFHLTTVVSLNVMRLTVLGLCIVTVIFSWHIGRNFLKAVLSVDSVYCL